MRFSWVQTVAGILMRPERFTEGEAQKIRIEIMANFHRQIPLEIKVAIPVDFEDPGILPSKSF